MFAPVYDSFHGEFSYISEAINLSFSIGKLTTTIFLCILYKIIEKYNEPLKKSIYFINLKLSIYIIDNPALLILSLRLTHRQLSHTQIRYCSAHKYSVPWRFLSELQESQISIGKNLSVDWLYLICIFTTDNVQST